MTKGRPIGRMFSVVAAAALAALLAACHSSPPPYQPPDRHKKPEPEQAAIANGFFHQRLGVGPGAIETERRQGIHFPVNLGDALFQHVEQIERRDVAGVEFVDDGARRRPHQFLIGCH